MKLIKGYWALSVPYAPPPYQTEWHPTEATGPWSVLSRGAFIHYGDAVQWARSHLNGTPYTLQYVNDYTEKEVKA